jgi:hypothetical protein
LSGTDISIFVGLPKPNIGFCSTVCCCKSMNRKKSTLQKQRQLILIAMDMTDLKQSRIRKHHIPVITLKYLIIIKKRMNGGRELALIQGQHYERHVKEFVHSI